MGLSWTDRLYLARAYELARRGIGNVSPNPPVGAVIVRGTETLGEGYHHRRGEAHAEVEAFRDAQARGFTREDLQAATLYVSLEPCNHFGRTPPCSEAVAASGVRRVVIGTLDPNPRTAHGGVRRLEEVGIEVVIADDPAARVIIEAFTCSMLSGRPYVTLKMASSLDGRIAPKPGAFWLTGDPAKRFVRELRTQHDLVLVGGGTARTDDPDLRPRPPHTRARPARRGVLCGVIPPPRSLKMFAPSDSTPLLIFPKTMAAAYASYADCADLVPVAANAQGQVDIIAALAALREREIGSVLCEGGPGLASALLSAGVVDRLEWILAPRFLSSPDAVPVLHGHIDHQQFAWQHVEALGQDLRLSIALNRATEAESAKK